MNVKDFEYIAEIGRSGSIIKASQALCISQPALSKFLQKIEFEIGTPLFQRVGRNLVPTYAGEQCIKAAAEILYLNDRLNQTLADITQQNDGQIKLGLPMSRSNYFIARILPLFYQQFPNICINIHEDNARTLLKKLSSGELNLIFINVTNKQPHLTYKTVSEEEMVLAVPASYRLGEQSYQLPGYRYPCLPPNAWSDLPFLMLNPDQMSGKFADQYLQKQKIRPHTMMKIRNLSQVLYSVQCGLGITICPSMPFMCDAPEKKIEYYSLPSDDGPSIRSTAIVYRSDAYLSVAEKILIWLITQHYA